MKMILTAGLLCAALLFAAVNAVHAKSLESRGDTVTPATLVGE